MLSPFYISGYDNGLINNKKPFLIPDKAFQALNNAYVWRDRVMKREGIQLAGRLRRVLTSQAQANADGTATYTIADILSSFRATEPNAELEPGSVVLTFDPGGANETVFTDQGDATFLRTSGVAYNIGSSSINYATGAIVLNFSGGTPALGITVSAAFNYFPSLPVMGIWQRERAEINDEQTIFFDQKYAYIYVSSNFQEFITGTTWRGSNSDFFWAENYRGSDSSERLFFVTNFYLDTGTAFDPIRYSDSATWAPLTPLITATDTLYQARIIIPYYGRLVLLNTWEGTTLGDFADASNFFARCRFSQIGDPTAADAWRSDQFGKGGFIDAPVNEEIISAIFFKNTLIVFFEQTTWQLRYVGEYGLPFIWERISSDFGSESTFSPILFDAGVLAVGDRAIVSADSVTVNRIDLDIPDRVFEFANSDFGMKRVHGVRDYQKEVVYWCYPEASEADVYPNKVLLYNYRNNTWAIWRNNVTVFGTLQLPQEDVITWDRDNIFWDDTSILWDDPIGNVFFPRIVCGNQQGFVHYFAYTQFDEPSLSITSMDLTVTPITFTVVNHNINVDLDENDESDVELVVYLEGANFLNTTTLAPVSSDLNNQIFLARRLNTNVLEILKYNPSTNFYEENFDFTPDPVTDGYFGGGTLRLLPRMEIQTKDFNPFQDKGLKNFTSYMDLLTDCNPGSEVTVEIYANTKQDAQENVLVGNQNIEQSESQFGYITAITQANPAQVTSANHGLLDGNKVSFNYVGGMTEIVGATYTVTVVDDDNFTVDVDSSAFTAFTSGGIWSIGAPVYYEIGSEYQWHRFYATATGQYLNFKLTYNNFLMNQPSTHQLSFVLNAMVPYFRPAGKNVF